MFCRERMQSSVVKLVTLAPGGARLLSTSSRLDRWILVTNCWKLWIDVVNCCFVSLSLLVGCWRYFFPLLSTSSRLDRWIVVTNCWKLWIDVEDSWMFCFVVCSGWILKIFASCVISCVHGRELSYKLVVVGGGAGGCGTANKFANKLGKDQVRQSDGNFVWKHLWMSGCCDRASRDALLPTHVDPGEIPTCNFILLLQFAQVGGGLKSLAQSGRPMENCLPK